MPMKQYTVQAPDGKTITLEGPEGATDEEVIAQAQRLYQPKATGVDLATMRQSAGAPEIPRPIPAGLTAPAGQSTYTPAEPSQAAPRGLAQSLPAMGGSLTGGALGAQYGAGVGAALGPFGALGGGFLGGVLGAGLGAIGGEGIRQGTNAALGYKDQFDPQRMAEEANVNMVGEGAGQALHATVPLIGAGLRGARTAIQGPMAAEKVAAIEASQRAIRNAEIRGIPMTAADRSGGKTMAAVESGVGRTLFGRTPLQRATEEQSQKALSRWWEPEILDQIAPHMDATDIGVATQQALGQSKEKVLSNVTRMFDTATELAKARDVQIPDAPIRQLAHEVLSSPELTEAIRRAPSLADNESLRLLRQLEPGIPDQYVVAPGAEHIGATSPATPDMAQLYANRLEVPPRAATEVSSLGREPGLVQTIPGKSTMPFGTAEILRKAVQKIVRDASDVGVNIGRFKQLGGVIDDSMRQALQEQAPDAFRVWEAARQLYGPAKQELGSLGKEFAAPALQRLAKANPEEVVSQVMKSGLNGIETAKKYLEFSPVWPQIQRSVLEQSMERALTPESSRIGQGLIRGQHWQTQFNKNLPALKRILSPETMGQIEDFNNTVRRFRTAEKLAGNPSESGAALTSMGDMTTVAAVIPTGIALAATGHPLAAAATIGGGAARVLGPNILARILADPSGPKLLIEALRTPTGTSLGTEIATRLAAYTQGSQAR